MKASTAEFSVALLIEEHIAAACEERLVRVHPRSVHAKHRLRHGKHARREIQRKATEQHEKKDRQRPAAFEESRLFDSGLCVSNELQEIISGDVAAGAARDHEQIGRAHV